MNFYRAPQGDKSRQAFLNTAVKIARSDHARNLFYVSAETLQRVEAFLPAFEAQLALIDEKKDTLRSRRQARNAILKQVKSALRTFWNGVRLQVDTYGYPAAVYGYYGLSAGGRNPRMPRQAEVIPTAQMVLAGEARAAADGYLPVGDPQAAQLQDALEAAISTTAVFTTADSELVEARATLAADRRTAAKLVRAVMRELRFNLDHLPASSRRRIMRRYGAQFYTRPDGASAQEEIPAEDAAGTSGKTGVREADAAAVYVAAGMPAGDEPAVVANGHSTSIASD